MLSNLNEECDNDTFAVSEDLREININIETTGATLQELRLDNQQEKIVRWLSAPDPSTNHTNAREKCHEGTGLWFIDGKAFENGKGRQTPFSGFTESLAVERPSSAPV